MAQRPDVEFAEITALASFPASAKRLKLVRKVRRHAELEAGDPRGFAEALGARVPESWPPAFFAPGDGAEELAWANYYMIVRDDSDGLVLAGWTGVTLRPAERALQFGAAFVPEYQGKRLSGDLVSALLDWAQYRADIDWVICDIPGDRVHAAKALESCGFSKDAAPPAPGFVRFALAVVGIAHQHTVDGRERLEVAVVL